MPHATPVFETLESRTMLSGTTLDDFQFAPGQRSANHAAATDPAGNLYTSGFMTDASGAVHGNVRQGLRQPDGSFVWQTLFDLSDPNSPGGEDLDGGLVVDPATADVYAAGNAHTIPQSSSGDRWIVVRRSATDASVSVLDNYQPTSGQSASPMGMARDSAGNLFVAGRAYITTSSRGKLTTLQHWIVREMNASTGAWSTIEDFLYQGGSAFAADVAVDAAGAVYVTGEGFSSSNNHWLTQKGTPTSSGTFTWTTLDDFTTNTVTAQPQALAIDPATNSVYVTGYGAINSGKKPNIVSTDYWITRRSTNAGPWSTVDQFAYANSPGGLSVGRGFARDPLSGALYVVGQGEPANQSPHALVRRSDPTGSSWQTIDDWQLAPGQYAIASAAAVDPSGNLYSAGSATDSANSMHAIVRRVDTPSTLAIAAVAAAATAPDPSVSKTSDLNPFNTTHRITRPTH